MAESANSPSKDLITIQVTPAQIEQLQALGALTAEQAAAGKATGGMQIQLEAGLVAEFRRTQLDEVEALAHRIYATGLSGPAKILFTAGRPLTFFGSQLLLLAQPLSRFAFGSKDNIGNLSSLLEDRRNVDKLVACLETLEQQAQPKPKKSNSKRDK